MKINKGLIYGQNTQIVKYIVRGLKNPDFFLWKYSSMHTKAKGMTQFNIFHTLVENLVLCFFWALFYAVKSMPMFEQLQNQVLVNSTKFDPLLERYWCELFKMIKSHGTKNPPPSSPTSLIEKSVDRWFWIFAFCFLQPRNYKSPRV